MQQLFIMRIDERQQIDEIDKLIYVKVFRATVRLCKFPTGL